MFCTNCGNKLKDGQAFCTQCGKKVAAPAAPAPTPAPAPVPTPAQAQAPAPVPTPAPAQKQSKGLFSSITKGILDKTCVRCGEKAPLISDAIADGPVCDRCASELHFAYLPKQRLKLWSLEDLGEYEYYLKEMQKLKEKIVPDLRFEDVNGRGILLDTNNRILYAKGPELYFDARKLILLNFNPGPKTSYKMWWNEYNRGEPNDLRKRGQFQVVIGLLDPYFPVLNYDIFDKESDAYHLKNLRKDMYPLFPRFDKEYEHAYRIAADISFAAMCNNGIEQTQCEMGFDDDERETARAHFKEEQIALLCYMVRTGVITPDRYSEMLWAHTRNVTAAGLLAIKYKNYNPYFRSREMKAFGHKYCGEVDNTLPIAPKETGSIMSDEEVQSLLNEKASKPEVEKEKKKEKEYTLVPEDDESEKEMYIRNYLRAYVFSPTWGFKGGYFVDHTKNLLCFASDKDEDTFWNSIPSNLEIYSFDEIKNFRVYLDGVYVSGESRDERYYTGNVNADIEFETYYHDGKATYKALRSVGLYKHFDSYKDAFKNKVTVSTPYMDQIYDSISWGVKGAKAVEDEEWRYDEDLPTPKSAARYICYYVYNANNDSPYASEEDIIPELVETVSAEEKAKIREYRRSFAEECRRKSGRI